MARGEAQRYVLGYLFENLQPDMHVVNNDWLSLDKRKIIAEIYRAKMIVLNRASTPELESISTTKNIRRIKFIVQ